MSSQLLSFVAPPAVAVVVGLVFAFLGFRGRKPDVKYTTFFKIGGSLLLFAALGWFLVKPWPDGWSRHTTTDRACSIEFPQAPRHEVNPDGEEADRLEVALTGRNAHYSLTFSDVSPESAALPIDKQFDLLRDIFGSRQAPGGTPPRLLKELVINERGFPGREYQFVVGHQFVTRIKVFISGPRIYRAIAVNPPDPKTERDAQRFIDSLRFEITKP